MSELQKASCGWMGTQVQASTTKSRRLQLQRNTTRKLSHAVMLPPRCLLTSAEQEGSRRSVRRAFYSRFLTARAPLLPACLPPRTAPLCLAGLGSAAFAGASLRARQVRGCQRRGDAERCGAALRRGGPVRGVIASIAPSRAPGAPPPPTNGSPALPHRRERPAGPGAGPPLQRLIRNSAGSAGRARGRAVGQVVGRSEEKSPSLSLRPFPAAGDGLKLLKTSCTSEVSPSYPSGGRQCPDGSGPEEFSPPPRPGQDLPSPQPARSAPQGAKRHLENRRGVCCSLGKLGLFPSEASRLSASWF